jgi:hypothetical protein
MRQSEPTMNGRLDLIQRGPFCAVALVLQATAFATLQAQEPADFALGVADPAVADSRIAHRESRITSPAWERRSPPAAPLKLTGRQECLPHLNPTTSHSAIPWSEIGAKAGADYHGDGLSVEAETNGARLRCDFQKLVGEVTSEGLGLRSTYAAADTPAAKDSPPDERFRVTARSLSRAETIAEHTTLLPPTGTVSVNGQTARFTRSGLIEEFSVSMDGVRQDFIVPERPAGTGELQVQLDMSGATVERVASGAQLVLCGSGRKIAYSHLRVTDATGKELIARMIVSGSAAGPAAPVNGSLTGPTRDGKAHR